MKTTLEFLFLITAMDCNLDGIVNIKDVVLLAQYLAGWKVVLG